MHLYYVFEHTTKYQSCISKTVDDDSWTNHDLFMQLEQKKYLAIPVIFKIFKRNQNNVAMHIFTMYIINILWNIEAVTSKL